jgi:hypothetical protein
MAEPKSFPALTFALDCARSHPLWTGEDDAQALAELEKARELQKHLRWAMYALNERAVFSDEDAEKICCQFCPMQADELGPNDYFPHSEECQFWLAAKAAGIAPGKE